MPPLACRLLEYGRKEALFDMNRFLPFGVVLAASLASCACSGAQPPAPRVAMPSLGFGRVLIVSGGPDTRNNQYAIESNARYLASLTRRAKWRRILFADGNGRSKTISVLLDTPRTRARAVASWILDLPSPNEAVGFKAPTLAPLAGPSTPSSIRRSLGEFGSSGIQSKARELVYFTGHGAPGSTPSGGDDFGNTIYAGWNGDFSTRELARALQSSPSKAPLVLVMVQCHGGGFANTLFTQGDPKRGVWNRDFCGFFASTAERPAAGCTSQVNERDYQDFTTYFFAALSGVSRDGRQVRGADYNGDGRVSLSEAFAYAELHDNSIDVPVSTGDAFLRHVFSAHDIEWQRSYAPIRSRAASWQAAVLDGLSSRLDLRGDARLAQAEKRLEAKKESNGSDTFQPPAGVNASRFNVAFNRLQNGLKARFPRLASLRGGARTGAIQSATDFVASQTDALNVVYDAYQLGVNEDKAQVEEALLLRFLRCARTIVLEERLAREGTPAQKAVFARLRRSEDRSGF